MTAKRRQRAWCLKLYRFRFPCQTAPPVDCSYLEVYMSLLYACITGHAAPFILGRQEVSSSFRRAMSDGILILTCYQPFEFSLIIPKKQLCYGHSATHRLYPTIRTIPRPARSSTASLVGRSSTAVLQYAVRPLRPVSHTRGQ